MDRKREEDFLRETIAEWQEDFPYPLTMDDAFEIFSNTPGYFNLLDKWDREINGDPECRLGLQAGGTRPDNERPV